MSNRLLHEAVTVFEADKLVNQGNCGICFVADKKGRSRKTIDDITKATACNKLRGGLDALQTSSDGVGISTEIPWKLFEEHIRNKFGASRTEGSYGVGMLFLPDPDKSAADKELYAKCKDIIERAAKKSGLRILGWRDVPIDLEATGAEAKKTVGRPTQLFIDKPEDMTKAAFRKEMFKLARRISKFRRDEGLTINDMCIASMSNRDINYKGLCLPGKFTDFYQDFQDERYESEYALAHVRFSTNTRSMPPSAQPVTGCGTVVVAHNGEMNNYIGAARSFEEYMHSLGHSDFYFPEGISDSNMFSMALEAIIERLGWSLPAAMMMLNPPSINDVQDEYKPMVEYFMKTFKPWRGPANLVAIGDAVIDGEPVQIVLGHGDTGLQRPAAVTDASNMFYLGSETGILSVTMNNEITQKALRSGDFIGYDIGGKKAFSLEDILAMVKKEGEEKIGKPFQTALDEIQIEMPEPVKARQEIKFDESVQKLSLNRKLGLFTWDDESVRYYVEPMMRTAKDNIIAMGWDVAKPEFQSGIVPLHFMIKHRFAQLTSSVIDAYREKDFMPLDQDLGADHNLVSEARRIHLKSPILREGQLEQLREVLRNNEDVESTDISATYALDETLEAALERIADEAERRVTEGKSIIILSDIGVTDSRAAIPAFLATAAVSKRLKEKNMTSKASIVVQSGQIYDFHHAAILMAQGASAVDAYMLPAIADKLTNNGARSYVDPKIKDKSYTREELMENLYTAMDFGLQTIMSKMGVDDMRGYQNSSLLEVEGLDLSDKEPAMRKVFDGTSYLKGSIGLKEIDESVKEAHRQAISPSHVYSLEQRGGAEQPANSNAAPHIHGTDVELPAFRQMLGDWNIIRANQPEVQVKINELFSKWGLGMENASGGTKLVTVEGEALSTANPAKSFGAKEKYAQLMGVVHQMNTALKQAIADDAPLTKIITKNYISGFDKTEKFRAYQAYSNKVEKNRKQNPKTAFDLLEADTNRPSIPLEEVQPVEEILSRIFGADMSFGALTKQAHTWIDAGLNIISDTLNEGRDITKQDRLGPVSTSGEGGIPLDLLNKRYAPRRFQDGTSQFGLTAEALAQSDRIIFKAGQGAKPGMGGELPPNKVEVLVAINRGSMPHAGLTSPPSHDDVKSIEDWTLKCLALSAAGLPVDLKIVSQLAMGSQISGGQKAMLMSGVNRHGKTGSITISGDVGGTAASPITASAHSGMDGLKGLRIGDRALREAGLRDYAQLNSDGGVTTGADALRRMFAGADSVGMGTALMEAVGCILMRQCSIYCAAGVATNSELFNGAVDDVVDYVIGFAHEIRHEMARLGVKDINEIVGKTESLKVDNSQIVSKKVKKRYDTEVIKTLLEQVENIHPDPATVEALKTPPKYFDDKYVDEVLKFYEDKRQSNDNRQLNLKGESTNCDISIGAKLSVQIAKQKLARKAELEGTGIPEAAVLEKIHNEYGRYDQVILDVNGRTGQEKDGEQNFGAAGQYAGFLVANGLTVNIQGMAHDSCASALGVGGVVTIRPPFIEGYKPHENNIVKNHALLSATGGKFFASGSAGRNFAARNGGAEAVVEGVGDYACKFMGSGTVINLGKFGRGLCSAMAGGVFIQYDKKNKVEKKIAKTMAVQTLADCPEQESTIKGLLQEHADRTGSLIAAEILANWEQEKVHFKIAVPKEILQRQGQILEDVRTVFEVRRGEGGDNAVSRGEVALASRLWSDRVLGKQTLKSAGLDITSQVEKERSVA